MHQQEPGWELYRSFLGILQEGSLSGAARALGLTQPTVGRHLDALERGIGQSLFVRSQHGLSPTRVAEALRPYAESLAATSAALLRVAASQGADATGTVRITASEVIAVEVLPPILTRLRATHPGLSIELTPSNRVENLLLRDADIAVRMVSPSQAALIARRVGNVELGLYARQSYLDLHGTPPDLAALEKHTLIGFDQETPFMRAIIATLPFLKRSLFALRTDSDLARIAMLRAGFGIGICQVGLARREPDLVRLFPDQVAPQLDTWLAMHEDLRHSPCCQAAFAALYQGLLEYVSPP
ncbi:MAG TPA: LysR family transcriptional regulator [Janthinobacterium sp.]|nr:LysR family transcriptional regulator [Janthinobacterium sp.]